MGKARFSLLSQTEIEALYGLPALSEEDRLLYFQLSDEEQQILNNFNTQHSQAFFILQLGYFKAKQQFFNFTLSQVQEDLAFISTQYFGSKRFASMISKPTRLQQHKLILALFEYQLCSAATKAELQAKVQVLVKRHVAPPYLFRELLSYLEQHRTIIPGYSYFQDLIGKSLIQEKTRLGQVLKTLLTAEQKQQLGNLLTKGEALFHLVRLKQEPKDFNNKQTQQEIAKRGQLLPLYQLAKILLPQLEISAENIKYYASLVDYYTTYKLARLKGYTTYVYLLCFVYHRYQQLTDNLIDSFIYHVNQYTVAAKAYAKEAVYLEKSSSHSNLKPAGRLLKFFVNPEYNDQQLFGEIRTAAFTLLDKTAISHVARFLEEGQRNESYYEWEYYIKVNQQYKRLLRKLLLSIEFQSVKPQDKLLDCLNFLTCHFTKQKSLYQLDSAQFPNEAIPKKHKRWLYAEDMPYQRQKIMHPDKYEFWVYQQLRNRLEAGDIYVSDSIRFRSFEDDLISDAAWEQKESLLQQLDIPFLNQSAEEVLNKLEQELESLYVSVNQRIAQGDNPHVKVKADASQWTLPYEKLPEEENHTFYQQLNPVSIVEVLENNQSVSGFLNAFTHVLYHGTGQRNEHKSIQACIIALACNHGLKHMANMSDISYSTLLTHYGNYVRLETLREANDRTSNTIAKLPIAKYLYIDEELIHASQDGQKYETQRHTLKSRHSPKYFGLRKGVSAVTLVAHCIPVNTRVIGANDHESHYVYDLLQSNTSEIKPHILSTDTHGVNHVNFAVLHCFGYQFAPRYRDFVEEAKDIYGFKYSAAYKDYLIKPKRKINKALFSSEWDNIQRIMASLATKNTTQSIIISKLSSYARRNRTKKALWELDNIIKSLHILRYIDDLVYRQHIQKALNRGESYHKLRRAIFFANLGRLRASSPVEQQIWQECGRLVANNIILYNARLLSTLLKQAEAGGNTEVIEKIKKISLIAWRHINLYGRYEFNQLLSFLDMQALIKQIDLCRLDKLEEEELLLPFGG